MAEYIEREAAIDAIMKVYVRTAGYKARERVFEAEEAVHRLPVADVAEVVRCWDCIYSVPLDRNCELNEIAYLHCTLWRGEETKNVWHKYKKYYKDYSLVDRDGFCSSGERIDNETA